MKRLSKNLWRLSLALPCMMLAMGCEGNDAAETENNEPIELRISPKVAATRSVIQGGTQSGTGTNVMQNVVVYATGDDYTAAKNNNHAIYTQKNDGSGWENNGTPKIYLTNAEATIYAYYPAYQINTTDGSMGTTPISISGDFSTSSTINVSTLAEGTITPADNADGQANDITAPSSATEKPIAAAPGETDYMYATSKKASNASGQSSIELTMNHALSMISFRVYKGNTYMGDGKLTKIVMKYNDSSASIPTTTEETKETEETATAATGTMKIADGEITPSTTAATYIRTIGNEGYTIPETAADAKKFSILVLPTTASIGSTIGVTFTIDNTKYTTTLTAPTNTDSGNSGHLLPGKNYLYTVNLSGTELTISKVEVTAWSEVVVDGDLNIQ